jgi:hypothetical protein
MPSNTVPNPLPRRKFIQLTGGGIVFAAMPLSGCSTGYPRHAVQAWQAPVETDIRRWVLAHALLAPNPHNRQPWIADLKTDGQISLVCDAERLLPDTDPFGRQILIGCGAFIELAVIAAQERGHRVTVELFPNGAPGPSELPGGKTVARLSLRQDTTTPKDALFAQIRRRHTNKGVYDASRVVPLDVWKKLQAQATQQGLMSGAITEASLVTKVRTITRESFEVEMLTDRTYLESARLMRIGPKEIAQNPDGIALTGAMVQVMSSVGMFNRMEVPKRGSSNYEQTMKRWNAFETGSGYYWIASRTNTRFEQVNAGRAYVRAHLMATAEGVDMHPLSQAAQEFAEVKPQFDALRALLGLGDANSAVQMLVRVGYGVQAAEPSPRWGLEPMVRG